MKLHGIFTSVLVVPALVLALFHGCCPSGRIPCPPGISQEERSLVGKSDGIMRVLQVTDRRDSLVLRSQSCDFRLKDIRSKTFRKLADLMLATVTDPSQDGVGIAGPQVGIARRVVAVKRYDKPGEPFEVYPNIRILYRSSETQTGPEGCLSVPGIYGNVDRSMSIVISYIDPVSLQERRDTVEGYTAVIFQHETDHLDGVLFTDRMDPPSGNVLGKIRTRILDIADTADARIGVAAVFDGRDTLSLYAGQLQKSCGDIRFPLQSVVKFHQALAVCASLRENGLSLDSKVAVTPEMLHQDTWSPLRDRHPEGGDFSYRELMRYTLTESDNNACDILWDYTGGPAHTEEYIGSLTGREGFAIECTEAMMHADLDDSFRNWSTPMSAVLLLEKFRGAKDQDGYSRFVWETMKGCLTGEARIPGKIREAYEASGKPLTILHKTGTGDVLPEGRIIAVNDIGIVELPGGHHLSLAVFISMASCAPVCCEALIADIAEALCCYYGTPSSL